ncbi:MAG: FCD domain-containing protein [Streptosporangiales bacterium]|nr:FCD domain-containing protein [Streptosporangiales bacterium]
MVSPKGPMGEESSLVHEGDRRGMQPIEEEPPEDQPLRERVYRRLSEMIIQGEIKPGEPLREARLAEVLGTSRVPVREALQRLEEDGWVDRRRRYGARLKVPSRADIDEVFDLRRLLEVEAVRLAVRRASLEDVDRLRAIAREGRAATRRGDQNQVIEANARFHSAIAELSRNRLLAQTLAGLDRRVRWLYGFVRLARMVEHDEILAALEDRDARRAAAAVRDHVEQTRRLFQENWTAPRDR